MPTRPHSRSSLDRALTDGLPSRELSALLELSSALATTLDLEQVLQKAIESAVRLFSLDTGAIYLIEGTTLFLGATTPPLPADFPEVFRLGGLHEHPHIHRAVETGQPIRLEDTADAVLSEAEKTIVETRALRSILYVPFFLEDQPTGVLILGSTGAERSFTEHELRLARTLSNQIALAVDNARLFRNMERANRELRRAYDATLEGWSLALEMRDEATQGHTHRVTGLVMRLARRMKLPAAMLEHIRRGALLHDIGKMGIPDSILRNPETLTESEQAAMRRHPELARRFLEQIEYLQPALEIPYSHHEKWDGTGYPQGLKGEQIPLAARIFAVVDVYDALVSDRSYRQGGSMDDALNYIRKQAGKHFDPQVAEAFVKMMGEEG